MLAGSTASGAALIAGPAGPSPYAPAIAWSTGLVLVAQAPASVVTYNNALWLCTVPHTSGALFDPTKFIMLLSAVPGPAAFGQAQIWASDVTYVAGPPASLVSHSGSAYVCVVPHVSGGAFDPTKFVLLMQGLAAQNAPTSHYVTGVDSSGSLLSAQPSFGDLAGQATVAQLPAAIVGALQFQGTWNAASNSPTLASGVGTKGQFYKVSISGTTSIDGNAVWDVGDLIIFDGTVWDRVLGSAPTASTFVGDAGSGGASGLVPAPPPGSAAAGFVLGAGGSFVPNAPRGSVNQFYNPGCDVDQRNTRSAALTVTTAGAYTVDGKVVLPTGANVTAGQAAAPAGAISGNCLQITGAASNTGVTVRLFIEGVDAARFAGRTVTIQAKLFQNSGGAITPSLSAGHVTTVDTYSGGIGGAALTNEVNAAALQSAASGTVTQLGYTAMLSSSTGNGLETNFVLPALVAGKIYQLTDFDIRLTPGVAAGLNNAPPSPELPDVAAATARSQRYYWQGQGAKTLNPTNVTANISVGVRWPVTMRKAPSVAAAGGGTSAYGPDTSQWTTYINTAGSAWADMGTVTASAELGVV